MSPVHVKFWLISDAGQYTNPEPNMYAAFRGASIALDIAKGLHFLHSHHVMHLDLKSPNILLAQDGTAKVADVGLSRMFTTRSLPVAKVSSLSVRLESSRQKQMLCACTNLKASGARNVTVDPVA